MRFRSVPLVLGLFASLWAVKSSEADFLVAQDFKGKSISSIAYTYSGSTAVKPYFSQEKARFLHLTLCFARASDWPKSYICSH